MSAPIWSATEDLAATIVVVLGAGLAQISMLLAELAGVDPAAPGAPVVIGVAGITVAVGRQRGRSGQSTDRDVERAVESVESDGGRSL